MGRANIPEFAAECKAALDDCLYSYGTWMVLAALCIALFGLVRLGEAEGSSGGVQLAAAGLSGLETDFQPGGLVVGSAAKGTYFYPWCNGASKIADDDKEVFPSENDATQAGLQPGKGCKGLGASDIQ